jgi:TRAP-type C4-dicarboxylate transport system permease small subunit
MDKFILLTDRVNRAMDYVAGTVLVLMMILTVCDVILRYFKMPIPGTFELVSVAAGVVLAASLPRTSWEKQHVNLPMLVEMFGNRGQKVFNVITRFLSILLFAIFGYNLLLMGQSLSKTNTTTNILHTPLSPFAYLMGACCFIVCLILIADIVRTIGGGHEHHD